MPPGFSAADFYYLLPELIVTLGAIVVLVADVFLPRRASGDPEAIPAADRRVDVAVDGHRRRGRRCAGTSLGSQPDHRPRTRRRRWLCAVLQADLPGLGRHHHPHVGPVSALREHEARRVLLPDPLRDARHDVRRRRHRPHHDLHRSGDHGDLVLRARRLHPSEPSIQRGRDQVLRYSARSRWPSSCTACRFFTA